MDKNTAALQKNLENFLDDKFKGIILTFEKKATQQAATIEILKNIFKELQLKNAALEKKHRMLEEEIIGLKNKMEEETQKMKKRVKDLVMIVQDGAQEASQCKLEVTGVPTDVEYEDFTVKLFNKANLKNIKESDYTINVIEKKAVQGTPVETKSLVISFQTQAKRNSVIHQLRQERPNLTIRDVTGQGPNTPIFISEFLTPQLKRVLYEAKQVKREKQYKYLWVQNGQILLRKTSESNVVRILSLEDLQHI